MRTMLIDGGIHNRPKPPAPPPPPPAPRRTGSADRMEREAETPRRAAQAPASPAPLRTAARETEARVEAATAARADADALQALPPAAQAPLRGEIEQARTEATRAEAAAERAAAAEIEVARTVLSPTYFVRYVDDLEADQPHAAVQRAVSAARRAPPAPDPLQATIDSALRAQAEADRLLQHGRPSESYIEHVVQPARERADQAWSAVQDAVQGDLQRTSDLAQLPNAYGPTVDERARALLARAPDSARLAEIVGTAAARTSGGAIAADVERIYRQQGSDAAVRRLDTLTAGNRPEVARDALLALDDTLQHIGADLGARATVADIDLKAPQYQTPELVGPRIRYDQTVLRLADVAWRASLAEGGEAAVDRVAGAIARHVDPKNIGRLDEALGNAVRFHGSGTLALAVADQLQRDVNSGSGRKAGQADDILQNVVAALDELAADTTTRVENLVDDRVFQLATGYSVFVKPGVDANAVLEAYLRDHPDQAAEYRARLASVDSQGAALLRAQQSLAALPASLQGLGHADRVAEGLQDLGREPAAIFALSSSPAALGVLGQVMNGPRGEPFLAALQPGTPIGETVGGLLLRQASRESAALMQQGRVDEAKVALHGMDGAARLLGIDEQDFSAAVDAVGLAIDESVRAAGRPERLNLALAELDKTLDGYGLRNDGTASSAQRAAVGEVLRVAGFTLSSIGFGQNLGNLFDGDVRPLDVLQAAASSVDLAQGTAELLWRDAALLDSRAFRVASRTLVGFNAAVDLFSAGNNFARGDWAAGGLDATSAAGGGLAVYASITGGGVAGPVGVGLMALAAVGKLGLAHWRRIDDSNRLENDDTRAYLQKLGFDPAVAGKLMNADADGRSALPALAALAAAKGYDLAQPDDMKAFIDFLNNFGTQGQLGQLEDLVEHAHGVRNGDGELQVSLTRRERERRDYILATGDSMDQFNIESIEGLRWWMGTGLDASVQPDR